MTTIINKVVLLKNILCPYKAPFTLLRTITGKVQNILISINLGLEGGRFGQSPLRHLRQRIYLSHSINIANPPNDGLNCASITCQRRDAATITAT